MIHALLVTLALGTGPHPNSTSTSHLVVDGSRLVLSMMCQGPTVVESLGGDENGDLWLDAGELEAIRARLEAYFLEGWVLHAGGERLEGRLIELAPASPPSAFEAGWIELKLLYEAPRAIEELTVELRLFEERNPLHRDYTAVTWNGAEPRTFVLGPGARAWAGSAPAPSGQDSAARDPAERPENAAPEGPSGEGPAPPAAGGSLALAALAFGALLAGSGAAGRAVALAFALAWLGAGLLATGFADELPARGLALAAPLFAAYAGARALLVASPPRAEAFLGGVLLGCVAALGRDPGTAAAASLAAAAAGLLLVALAPRAPGRRRALRGGAEDPVPDWARASLAAAALVAGLFVVAERAGYL